LGNGNARCSPKRICCPCCIPSQYLPLYPPLRNGMKWNLDANGPRPL
jgi:hypothetical protein